MLDSDLQEKMYFLLNYAAGLGIQHGIAHLGYGALWIEAKNSLTRGSAGGSVKNGLLFNPLPDSPLAPSLIRRP